MKISNVKFEENKVIVTYDGPEIEEFKNEEFCIEFFEDHFVQCTECGRWFDVDELEFTADTDAPYCDDCIDKGDVVRRCDDCGEIYRVDNLKYCNDNDKWYCNNCLDYTDKVAACYDCGELHSVGNMVWAADIGEYVCKSCAEDNGGFCDGCGKYYYHDYNLCYNDRDGNYYCDDCYDEIQSEYLINEYHTSKNNGEYEFYDTIDAPLSERRAKECHFGYELEIDDGYYDNEEMAQTIEDTIPGFHFFENDGSLDDGFEIISNPATIDYLESIRGDLSNAFNAILRKGYRSHDAGSCGLHVHVDRKFFGDNDDVAVAKILFIFKKFWKELVLFSRRKEDQLYDWAKPYNAYEDGSIKHIISKEKDRDLGRYYAVNLTNRNTIEFRIARGTLKLSTFFATLKLYNNICNIAKNKSSVQIAKFTWEDILGDDEEVLNYWKSRTTSSRDSESSAS